MTRVFIKSLIICVLSAQFCPAQDSVTPTADVLPETKRLELSKPLHEVMVHGISQFAEAEIHAAREKRTAPWLTAEDPEAAKAAARERLRAMIGDASEKIDTSKQMFWTVDISDYNNAIPANVEDAIIAMGAKWTVAEGITGEGILYLGTGPNLGNTTNGLCVLLSDPDFPEDRANRIQLVEQLVLQGFDVIEVELLDRNTWLAGHHNIRQTNLTHREYVYRLGFELGLHPIGYEVQRVSSLLPQIRPLDFVESEELRVTLVGTGEGAVIAQYVAALHPELIDAVVLHGYFGPRENVWQEPIYRNVWNQLSEFGDAEIASLIEPTPLIIEAGQAPEVDGPPEAKPGQAAIAAPGVIKSPELAEVKKEFDRAKKYFEKTDQADKLHLVENPQQVCSEETIRILNKELGLKLKVPNKEEIEKLEIPKLNEEYQQAQQKRLVSELVRHTQMLLARADKVRAKLWKDVDRSSAEAWEKQAAEYREMVHSSFIGKLDIATVLPEARTRKIIDEPTHIGYEVAMNVGENVDWTEENPGIIAGGILLLPKDLKEGEQRPVVVCQHGLEGTPMDTITTDESQRAWRAYKGFSTQLVKRGFIVYAPQNPYKGYHDFRVIQRKSNPLGRSLFSYIIEQHRQTLEWLASLDYVDPERIAFYGLSYGGKTAVRVPPLLVEHNRFTIEEIKELDIPFRKGVSPPKSDLSVPGYCLSICSADFNEWIRKNASAEDRYSYVYTPEYEIFEWNMGHIANYAELSWLMAPRPFMVERGHDDGVAPDEWVGWEFAKVRRHYNKLGIGDKTEIEWFNGPHTINGDGTFKFLHKHLNWPEQN